MQVHRFITWNIVPSSSAKAFTACSANKYDTKANPRAFFVILSVGRYNSASGPKENKNFINNQHTYMKEA